MDIKKLKRELRGEGFKEIYLWKDKPNEAYMPHSHKWETRLVILYGSIKVKLNNRWRTAKSGDSIDIRVNQTHEAVVGPRGCQYLVGEGKTK